MIPRVSSGRGFKGAAAYYLHDKNAQTSNRVRFTHTLNLANDNPEQAVNEMCWTAMHQAELKEQAGVKGTGRKLEKPVYTFSLSWHASESPTDKQMQEAGLSALKALKMENHQVLMVAHNDTDHPHIHLMVNRVDPQTGKAHTLNKDQLILSKWAEKYERDHGKTWCKARVANNAERLKGKFNGRGNFVKDDISQQRDSRVQFNRRANAIEAKRLARAAQEQAQQARQTALKPDFARSVDVDGQQARQRAVEAARTAQQAAREARERQARQMALDAAAKRDARKGKRELYRAKEIEPPSNPAREAASFRQQQQDERKREAFEQWQIEQINAIQDRHNEERDRLAKAYELRKRLAEETIKKEYGVSKRQMEKRLAVLKDREQNGSGLSRMVDRMRGVEAERDAIEKGLANIEQRINGILAPIAKQQAEARDELAERHQQEKHDQAGLFDRQRQAGYEIPSQSISTAQKRGPSRGFGRDFGGGRGM